ncbi:MAG: MFS transporter [Solirubrobacterales bacterium]
MPVPADVLALVEADCAPRGRLGRGRVLRAAGGADEGVRHRHIFALKVLRADGYHLRRWTSCGRHSKGATASSCGSVLAILLLDKVGRRPLLIVGTIGCVISLVVLGIFFASSTLKHDFSGLALICLIVYIASFAIGLGPVFWLMISEIFPLKVRSAAMSVSTVANWASNFLVSTFSLTLTGAITIQGTFWLYAGFGVAAILFFFFRLPETKNRSLEEISEEVSDETVTE